MPAGERYTIISSMRAKHELLHALPLSFFSVLPEKKVSAAPGIAGRRCRGQEKAAWNLRSRALGGLSRSRPAKGNAARWRKKEKGAARDRQLRFRYSVRATAQPGCELFSSGKPVCPCFRGGLRLRSRRCLCRKRRSGTADRIRSPGRIQRGAEAPLCVVSK